MNFGKRYLVRKTIPTYPQLTTPAVALTWSCCNVQTLKMTALCPQLITPAVALTWSCCSVQTLKMTTLCLQLTTPPIAHTWSCCNHQTLKMTASCQRLTTPAIALTWSYCNVQTLKMTASRKQLNCSSSFPCHRSSSHFPNSKKPSTSCLAVCSSSEHCAAIECQPLPGKEGMVLTLSEVDWRTRI